MSAGADPHAAEVSGGGPAPTPTPGPASRRVGGWGIALAIFALALGLRLAYVDQATRSPFVRVLAVDPKAYHDRAVDLAEGRGAGAAVFYQDPLYPYAVALVYRLAGVQDPRVVAFCQAALDAVTTVLVLALGGLAFGRAAGVLAGLLAALYPVCWYYDALLLKAALSVFLATATLVAALVAEASGRARWWLAAGFLLGLAALTRGNYLAFLPALAGFAAWTAPRPRGRRSALRAGLVVVLGAALPIAPVTLRNRCVGGEWVLITSQAGANLYIGNNPDNLSGMYKPPPFVRPTPAFEAADFHAEAERRAGRPLAAAEVSALWTREAIAYARREPGHFLRHLARKAALLVNAVEVPDNDSYAFFRDRVAPMLRWPLPGFGALWPFAVVGAAAVALRGGARGRLLLLYAAVYAATILASYNFSRYRMPLVPVLVALAAHGAVVAARLARQRRAGALLAAAALAAGAGWIAHRPLMRDEPAVYLYNLGYELNRLASAAEADREPYYARALAGADASPAARAARLRALAEGALAEAHDRRPADAAIAAERVALHAALARAAGLAGRPAEALVHAEVVAALAPADPLGHSLRALALADLGRPREADEAHARARALAGRAGPAAPVVPGE